MHVHTIPFTPSYVLTVQHTSAGVIHNIINTFSHASVYCSFGCKMRRSGKAIDQNTCQEPL